MSKAEELRALHRLSRRCAEAKSRHASLWREQKEMMRELHESGVPLSEIASQCGVTKARVWQIVKDYRNI